jgi:hypothetical protein
VCVSLWHFNMLTFILRPRAHDKVFACCEARSAARDPPSLGGDDVKDQEGQEEDHVRSVPTACCCDWGCQERAGARCPWAPCRCQVLGLRLHRSPRMCGRNAKVGIAVELVRVGQWYRRKVCWRMVLVDVW